MDRLKLALGVVTLLSGALCGAAQEQAAWDSHRHFAVYSTPEKIPSADTPAANHGARSARTLVTGLAFDLLRPASAEPEPPRTWFGRFDWSEIEQPFDNLRRQFQVERARNCFRRELKLHLAGVGPVQLAAFESRQRGVALHAVTQYTDGRTGEGALRVMQLSRPTSRSYGLSLAFRWN